MKKYIILFVGILLFCSSLPASEVVFSEKFNNIKSLEEIGFKKIRDNKKDVFEIINGELRMTFFNSPNKGTSYRKKVAIPKYGELNFELRISPVDKYDNFSLQMKLGKLLFGFRNPYWRILCRSTNKWLHAGKISTNEYHKLRIRFNTEKKYAEYYVDDMKNPVLVDNASDIQENANGELVIANYGHASGKIVHTLQSIELKKLNASVFEKSENISLRGTWIFYGIGYENWRLADLRSKCPQPAENFFLQTIGSHPETTLNKYELHPNPPVNPDVLPSRIIFADMPLRPIPEYARKNILNAVRSGAKLLILNGFFTLNKGDFAGTEFAEILPIDISDPWNDAKITGGVRKDFNTVFSAYGKGEVGVFLNKKLSSQAEFDMLVSCITK